MKIESVNSATLAQLVERHFCKVDVVSSNLTGGSNYMRRIFLASSINITAKAIAAEIKKEFGNGKKRLLFITTASELKQDKVWQDKDRQSLIGTGFLVTDFTITGKTVPEIKSAVQGMDVIHFEGGNSFYLLKQLQKTNSIKVFKSAVEKGKIYIGSSAGSVIVAPDILSARTLDNMAEAGPLPNYEGLSIVDFLIFPHWGNDHFKERYMNQKMANAYPGEDKIILLRDNQYVSIKNEMYKIVEI